MENPTCEFLTNGMAATKGLTVKSELPAYLISMLYCKVVTLCSHTSSTIS